MKFVLASILYFLLLNACVESAQKKASATEENKQALDTIPDEYISIKYIGPSNKTWHQIFFYKNKSYINYCDSINTKSELIHYRYYVYIDSQNFSGVANYIEAYNNYSEEKNYDEQYDFTITIYNKKIVNSYLLVGPAGVITDYFDSILFIFMRNDMDEKKYNLLTELFQLPTIFQRPQYR